MVAIYILINFNIQLTYWAFLLKFLIELSNKNDKKYKYLFHVISCSI